MPEFHAMRNDVDRAQHFVNEHGQDIHYCYPWRKWYTWDRRRWAEDQSGAVLALARQTAEDNLDGAEALEGDRRKECVRNANQGLSLGKLKAAVELAATYPGVAILPREFDPNPWLLNCMNGVLDLRTKRLRAPFRVDNITKLVPYNYNPRARCDRFLRFMEEIMPADETRSFMQRAIGYSLTGDVSEQIMLILLGLSGNGKSTLLRAICRPLGEDYSMTAPHKLLTVRKSEATNDLMDLQGRRFVVCIESEQGEHLAEALVKTLTGGDIIRGRQLYQTNTEFPPTFKIWLATNHAPQVHGEDPAMGRRMRLIRFDERFVPAEEYDENQPHTHVRDPELETKLANEAEGILAWAVEGCMMWQEHGLGYPARVVTDTLAYLAENDPIGRFVEEECLTGDRYDDDLPELYAKYKEWCQAQGMNHPWSKQAFTKSLVECHNCRKTLARTTRGSRFMRITGIARRRL